MYQKGYSVIICLVLLAILVAQSGCVGSNDDDRLNAATRRLQRELANVEVKNDDRSSYLAGRYRSALNGVKSWKQSDYPRVVAATVEAVESNGNVRKAIFVQWVDLDQVDRSFMIRSKNGDFTEVTSSFKWNSEAARTWGETAWRHTWIPIASENDGMAAWNQLDSSVNPIIIDSEALQGGLELAIVDDREPSVAVPVWNGGRLDPVSAVQ